MKMEKKTVTISLTRKEYENCELIVHTPEDLDEVYGLNYDEYPVMSHDENELVLDLTTDGNRLWVEYLVCRAEDIATWDTCPKEEERYFRSIAKKIEAALNEAGFDCRRWWTAPRNTGDLIRRYAPTPQ
jgi:hypothetical protein